MKELFKEYLLMIIYFVTGVLALSLFIGFLASLNNNVKLGNVIENYEVYSSYASYSFVGGGEN